MFRVLLRDTSFPRIKKVFISVHILAEIFIDIFASNQFFMQSCYTDGMKIILNRIHRDLACLNRASNIGAMSFQMI